MALDRFVVVEASRTVAGRVAESLLVAKPGAEIVRYVAAGPALEALRRCPARMLVAGLDLPDLDGIDLLETVAAERLAWRVLAVVRRRDERTREWLRTAPVEGWFDDLADDPENLAVAAIRVAEGGRYASPPEEPKPEGRCAPHLGQLFTAKERLVFSAIGAGGDDGTVARQLGLGAATVHWHRQRIMRKLGVQSRGDLIREALARGVVRFGSHRVLHPGFERELRRRAETGGRAAA